MLEIAESKEPESLRCLGSSYEQLWKTHVLLPSVDLSDQKEQEEQNFNSI